MKTLKSILILSLCILFIDSCKKNNDLGGNDPDTAPTGKVELSKFGMRAYFPENKWGNQISEDFNTPGYKMECIFTYLKDSKMDDQTGYSVHISFMRFISPFENENKANEMINEIKRIYDESPDYLSIADVTSTSISSYNALKMKYKKITSSSIEESYYIYWEKRLYRIVVVMPEDKISNYYAGCMEIINTLKITGKD